MILACVDRSDYRDAVCDHAAWLAGPDDVVDLLHVREPDEPGGPDAARRLLRDAGARLEHQGAPPHRLRLREGRFRDVVQVEEQDAGALVLGKRGARAGDDRRTLGSNATERLARGTRPLCLVSQVYLPISRGLVLIDADPDHRRAVDHVAANPRLLDLELDILLMTPEGADGEPKLAWARERLGSRGADVFGWPHGSADEAAARYIAEHPVDLIVISREALFADGAGDVSARPLWSWRMPLLFV